MTSPNGAVPEGALGVGMFAARQAESEEQARARATNGAWKGSWNGAQGEFRERVLTPAEQQRQIINDHSQSIEEIRAAVGQGLLQGQSIKYETNNTYYPSEGITSIDVILIGAGGGGGGAKWDVFFGSLGGCGGSGGGEVHTTIPASLLPVDSDGKYLGIPIIIGEGGAGAPYHGVGSGGGNTRIGDYLTAGGGVGGDLGSTTATPAAGGVGMIAGGRGGVNHKSDGPVFATPGGNSVSAYSLNGGGGGGGAGAGTQGSALGSNGGVGGISPGGIFVADADGARGSDPSPVVATGGGGGAGGGQGRSGGAGGYPGGGGGGAGGSNVDGQSSMRGGAGAHGVVFVIERFG